MAVNQFFDYDRMEARAVLRPGFDIILAVARARQTGSPTARHMHREVAILEAGEAAAVRRGLFGGGQAQSRSHPHHAARFFENDIGQSQDIAQIMDAGTEINVPFTRAFQPMLKHSGVTPLHQADGTPGVESIVE